MLSIISPIRNSIRPQRTVKYQPNSATFYKKQIQQFGDVELRKVLEKIPNAFSKENISYLLGLGFVYGLIQKYNMCKDENIKQTVKTYITEQAGEDEDVMANALTAEAMLDCVNISDGKYSSLYLPEIGFVSDKKTAKDKSLWSEGRLSAYYFKDENLSENESFQNHNRFASIIQFIKDNPTEENVTEYLWTRHYIPHIVNKQPGCCTAVNKMLDIKNRYGTLVFIDSIAPETNIVLNYVKKEFEMWEKAGGKEVIFPTVLDLTDYNSYFKENNSSGVCDFVSSIAIKKYCIQESLRHEMVHLNDMSGVYENEENTKIKPEPKVKLTPFERSEMIKAGLSKDQLKRAEENEFEKRAVFAEVDMSKYTEKMKQHMVEEGFPECAVKLQNHTDKTIYKRMYAKTYGADKTKETIKFLKTKFNVSGIEGVLKTFLSQKISPDEVKYILRKKSKKKYQNLEEYFNTLSVQNIVLFCVCSIKSAMSLFKNIF